MAELLTTLVNSTKASVDGRKIFLAASNAAVQRSELHCMCLLLESFGNLPVAQEVDE
jgi:hypothetical protein